MELCSILCGSLDGTGVSGRMYTCLCVVEPLRCSPKIIISLIDYTPIQHARWHSGKEPACQCRRHKRRGFDPWVRRIPWRRKWQPTPVFLPGECHGQRSLAGYSPQGRKESDTTEVT